MWVTVVIALLSLAIVSTHAQLGVIQSVSRYKSCVSSPLYQPNSDTCTKFTDDQEVIVIRAQVRPSSRANVQNLVFTLRDLPSVDQTHIFQDGSDQSLACRGVPVGAECNVAENVLVISFDASRMFAGYTLQQRPRDIPACYSIQAVTNLQNCNKTDVNCTRQKDLVANFGDKLAVFTGQSCSTIGGISSMASLNAAFPESSGGDQSACPTKLADEKAQAFYTAPATYSLYSGSTGECPLIYCRTQTSGGKSNWTLSSPQPVPYQCSVYDIEPTARAVMGADVVLQTKGYAANGADVISTERLQVSTIKGGLPVRSVNSPVVAQLLRINKGLGVAGPIVLGAIVTCNAGGFGNNAPGTMNDAPGRLSPEDRAAGKGSVLDDFYNPYTEINYIEGDTSGQSRNMLQRCTLPVEACRRMMLPKWYRESLNTSLPVGHYYYVSFGRLNQYGEQCNQNGMNPQQIFQSLPILYGYCEAQADSSVQAAGQCVPGYRQKGAQNIGVGDINYHSTPVGANINHANYLATVEARTDDGLGSTGVPQMIVLPETNAIPSVDFMPLDYLTTNPNYWLAHGMLVREGLFGSSSSVSLDIQIMVQATEFLGEVTARSSGTFVDTGMSCDAVTSGQGRVAYTTQSTGSIGGEFYVVPTAIIPPGGAPNTNVLPDLESILLTTGTTEAKEVQYQRGQWSARNASSGGRTQQSFAYVYSGPLQNMLQFRLDLYIRAGSAGAGFALVDTVTVGCTITRGVVQDLAGKTAKGKTSKGEDLSNVYQCIYWYNNIFRCWGHYDRTWKPLVNIMVTVVVFVSALSAAVTGVLSVCLAYWRGPKVIKVSRAEMKQYNENMPSE